MCTSSHNAGSSYVLERHYRCRGGRACALSEESASGGDGAHGVFEKDLDCIGFQGIGGEQHLYWLPGNRRRAALIRPNKLQTTDAERASCLAPA